MHDGEVREMVASFADNVLQHATSEYWSLTSSNVELLVDVAEDEKSCSYYFLDHELKVIFWLDERSTEEFDIPYVSGHDHLSKWSWQPLVVTHGSLNITLSRIIPAWAVLVTPST